MVDWNSPAVIAQDGLIFMKFMHALLGLYCWEWFISLDFDLAYITGKKVFRWPLILYFANRYSLLFALIGITIALNVTSKINCQALYTFNVCMGNFAIGLASVNLAVRTIAVWSQKWYIVVPIIAIILGHWSLLFHGIVLTAVWDPTVGCVITSTNNTILSATFIYSMCFDFVVLCLTGYKLSASSGKKSRIVSLIFADGLVYFIVAFLANTIAVIFMLLGLNPVMSIIANVPACIISTTMACRAVRRLANFTSVGAEIYSSHSQGSTLALRSKSLNRRPAPPVLSIDTKPDGIHVQMTTYEKFEGSTGTIDVVNTGTVTTFDAEHAERQLVIDDDEYKREAI